MAAAGRICAHADGRIHKRSMPRRGKSQPDPLATFPEWARRLAERYYTKTVSTFILHGDVRDLQPATEDAGSPGGRAEAAGRSIDRRARSHDWSLLASCAWGEAESRS